MNGKMKVLFTPVATLALIVPALPGCSGADVPIPKKADAPAPPPTPKELKVPKRTGGQEYGANARYQKAFKALNKVQD
jgi:hypothetical protein